MLLWFSPLCLPLSKLKWQVWTSLRLYCLVKHVLHRRSKGVEWAEDTEVTCRSKVPGVDDIHPEVLKPLDFKDGANFNYQPGPICCILWTWKTILDTVLVLGKWTVQGYWMKAVLRVSPSSLHRLPLLCGLLQVISWGLLREQISIRMCVWICWCQIAAVCISCSLSCDLLSVFRQWGM